MDEFVWNLVFEYFFEIMSRKFCFHWNRTRITGTLHEDQSTYLIISRSNIRRIRNVSVKFYREIQKTHFMFNNGFSKIITFWGNVDKFCRTGQDTDDTMAHVVGMLDTEGYKHTLGICNTYCFSTATMVARRRLNITLYVHVHCLSCYISNATERPMYLFWLY
jgi:hypothetical protein